MKLKYQKQIESIDNCPLDNQSGDKILFRCVENPITINSFEPHAVIHKPKFQNTCVAWGLSFFGDLKSANATLKNLSKKMQQKVELQSIASGKITDDDGIKHSTKNKNHFTFYPKNDLDLISKFAIVNENEK